MTCEIETTSRQVTEANVRQFSEGVSESSTNPEINSIRSQLEQMSTILKGGGALCHNCPNEYPVEGSVNWGNQTGEAAK